MYSQQQWTLGMHSCWYHTAQAHLKTFPTHRAWLTELVGTCSKLYSCCPAYLHQPANMNYNKFS